MTNWCREIVLWFLCAGLLACSTPTHTVVPAVEVDSPAVKTVPPPEASVTQDAGEMARAFLAMFVAGQYTDAVGRMNAKMAQAVDAPKAEAIWQGIVSQVGPLQEMLDHEVVEKDGYRTVFLICRFATANLQFVISFDSEDAVAGFFVRPAPVSWSAPGYADPDKFTERELTVGQPPWELPATLSMPSTGGRVPVVILVHGSGPNDRDESAGGTRIFKDLAWGLASRGIAVLRYEKRTRHYAKKYTPELAAKLTVKQESVDDPLAIAAQLRTMEGIDPERVYVVGHSQGGSAIPRIARGDAKLAGFVIMGGSTRPMESIVEAQITYLLGLDGDSPEDQAHLAALREKVERARNLKAGDEVSAAELPLGIHAAFLLDLRAHPHADMLQGHTRPILVLQGERDYQVTMEDFEGWKKLLADHPDATFISYPAGNHFFVDGEGLSTPAEYQQPGHMAAKVVDDIATWVLAR